MARNSPETNADIITFRVPAALKAAFVEIAREEAKPVGELLRDLIRERIKQKARREFEAEARRECLAINAAARDPDSDEAAVMRELEADLEEFSKEWR